MKTILHRKALKQNWRFVVISSLRLFFSSRYFCSLSFPLSLSFLIHVTNTPLSLFIQQRIQVTTTTDRQDRQTDRQTNKHTTLRCAIWYTLKTDVPCFVSFSIYFLPRRCKNRRRIGLNLSLFLFSLSLSLSSKGGKYEDEEDAKRGEFAPSPSRLCVCVCVCLCKEFDALFWVCASYEKKETKMWRRSLENKEEFSLFSLTRRTERTKERKNKLRLQNNALIIIIIIIIKRIY